MRSAIAARRKMFREVRNLGFEDQYSQRPTKYAPGFTSFRCQRGARFLILQLWSNGNHRVSHGTIKGPGREVEKTPPTDFITLPEMYRAIAFEWQRPSISADHLREIA
jgi:hypothetical protein